MGQLAAPARAQELIGIKFLLLAAVQHEEAMKPLQSANHDAPSRALEADISAVADALFRRLPTLIGFSVRDGDENDAELQLTVSMYPEPRDEERGVVLGEIAQALQELVDEAPGAGPLLRARTFARTLH
jgi:hypothetical protein